MKKKRVDEKHIFPVRYSMTEHQVPFFNDPERIKFGPRGVQIDSVMDHISVIKDCKCLSFKESRMRRALVAEDILQISFKASQNKIRSALRSLVQGVHRFWQKHIIRIHEHHVLSLGDLQTGIAG